MPKPGNAPTVSLYHKKSNDYYYARVYWPGGKRTAYKLATADPIEAAVLLEDFTRHELPKLIAQNSKETSGKAPSVTQAGHSAPGAPTLHDIAQWFLHTHLPYLDRAPKTISHYTRVLTDFTTYCARRHVTRPQQLSTRIIQEWQQWLSTFRPDASRPVARRDELLALRHFLTESINAGEIPERIDIAWHIPKKTKSNRFRALSMAELQTLLDAAKTHAPALYPSLNWLAHTGWRISDVLDLRQSQILPSGHIDRPQLKTKSQLLYPLTPALREILAAIVQTASPFVFLTPTGEPWTYQAWAKRLEHLCTKIPGLKANARDLRKTFATHQAMNGCPPNVLKELLGHADIALTLSYYVDVDLPAMSTWSEKFSHSLTIGNQR